MKQQLQKVIHVFLGQRQVPFMLVREKSCIAAASGQENAFAAQRLRGNNGNIEERHLPSPLGEIKIHKPKKTLQEAPS